jgi:predicted ribosome quality control (RQC) complex YloA/Tae2 family protein
MGPGGMTMPFDGLVLAAVRSELEDKLIGGRIERIHQPGKTELIILVHKPGARQKLLLSAHAQNARVHLTETTRANPTTPPVFCMVLRKHLEGGRITGFSQDGLERVLVIKIESRDELGCLAEKNLVCEIMGKHSNIILLDPAAGAVVDGIKRYSHAVSRFREILPGRPYLFPPSQGKLNPLLLDEEQFRLACLETSLDTTMPNLLQKRFEGLSIVTCREIIDRAGLAPDMPLDHCGDYELRAVWDALHKIINMAVHGVFEPCLVTGKRGEPLDYAALDLNYPEQNKEHGEMNSLLDCFFAARERMERLAREKNSITSLLNKEIAKLEKKLNIYSESHDNIAGAEIFRLYGELLTANLYRLAKGATETTLENFHEENAPPVTIVLDPQHTPVENAQAYFKKYSKSKKTGEALKPLILQVQDELAYLEGIKAAADYAAEIHELSEIRYELAEQGYLKKPVIAKTAARHKKEKHIPRPLSFISIDGFQMFAGKNNVQNDHLTIKMAREEDIWLHAKDIPGAHVIIRTEGKEVPPSTYLEAAGLAALFSKARKSKKVPVDYTLKKHVHKPKGARPGMVIYEHQKTIMAAPDEELAERLSSAQPDQK